MQLGVFSGVPADDDCSFSDEETAEVSMEEEMEHMSPEEELEAVQYDLMTDLLDADMFKVYLDMIQQRNPAKFGYLPMMVVATLGTLNTESFCERVLSYVKLVVSDLHVCLKADEIRMLVILWMNREFMEYIIRRASYPDTQLSEFKEADTYVCAHGGVDRTDF